MKILITGGAGFIGSYLIRGLIKNNEVVVIDNLETKKNNIQGLKVKFHKTDITGDIEKYFKDIDIVYHFAADPDVKTSVENPLKSFNTNVRGTLNVLEACRKNDVKKIVFASTSTIYGETEENVNEEHEIKPISPYGASKASCDSYISAYSSSYGITGISLVLANIYGPISRHGVIYDFYQKLKRNPNKLEILGNGKQKKSYLYVDDCVDAILLASDKVSHGYEKLNIGSDEWLDVNKIANLVCKEMKLKPEYKYTGSERGWTGDVIKIKMSIDKIRKLGFKPKVSIEQGIREYIKWLEKSSSE